MWTSFYAAANCVWVYMLCHSLMLCGLLQIRATYPCTWNVSHYCCWGAYKSQQQCKGSKLATTAQSPPTINQMDSLGSLWFQACALLYSYLWCAWQVIDQCCSLLQGNQLGTLTRTMFLPSEPDRGALLQFGKGSTLTRSCFCHRPVT